MIIHNNIEILNTAFNQYQMRGVCYSDEDHPLEFSLEVDGKKLDVPITRIPAVELLSQSLSTYYQAYFTIGFSLNKQDFRKLHFVAEDLKTKTRLDLSAAKMKSKLLPKKNLWFYGRRISPYIQTYGFRQFLRRMMELALHLPESPETKAAHSRYLQKLQAGTQQNMLTMLSDRVPSGDLQRISPFVLIIAEMSIPQCKYYRVEQKIRMLETVGIPAEAVSWTDKSRCLREMQRASLVVFYRVPFQCDVYEEYQEAQRLGLKIGFDVDDLIFDLEEYSRNPNLKALPEPQQKSLLEGALMYQTALKNADFTIASTEKLRQFMKKYCPGPSYCVPNAVMDDPSESNAACARFPLGREEEIIIGYGSGTSTHDRDFDLCSGALLRILKEYPQTSLTIHGMLKLPKSFSAIEEKRIHRVEFIPFSEYSQAIQRFDINLIPLERNCFNDCKSNIKYLEASKAGIPSIASPCAEFRKVIVPGENGFLAENPEQWYEALKQLVESRELRIRIGTAARETVYRKYAVDVIGKTCLLPILNEQMPPRPVHNRRKKVLIVNVLYPPVSFGGATIVAENIASDYEKHMDTAVFCLSVSPVRGDKSLIRYHYRDTPVFLYEICPEEKNICSFPEIQTVFSGLLESFRPDLVHFHSIQYMGAEMLDCCRKEKIPYLVTAHDAWWICERQFMLDRKQHFCHQDEHGIDLYQCSSCTKSKTLFSRWNFLQSRFRQALLITTPSDYMRSVYIKSGIPADLIRTNRNGIEYPRENVPRHMLHKTLTFAYLGGKCHHKGYYFLMEAVKQLHGDYLLKLVDINLKFNAPSINQNEWPDPERVEICLPYDHHSMDEFYNTIDVLLFPSKWKESFGLTIREALARNIWVVATDAGGDIETDLKNSVNGNLVPMYDTDSFRDAMQNLIDHPEILNGYENPFRNQIRTPEQQFAELKKLLAEKGFSIE
ncbi:MAG: glycosyltransferase [Lentisphaeria bacterium]|nr:glycosyltransferase [Lentisphaeria bacterium]